MTGTLDLNGVTATPAFEWQGRLMTRPQLIPGSERPDWEANRSWLVPDFWDPDTEDAWMRSQAVVVKSGGRTILVDAGIGNHKPRPYLPPFDQLDTSFLDSLREAGADPADVDIVINTHLHVDHVGWNTRLDGDQWVPTFPNAVYLFPKADFDHWNPEAGSVPPGGLTAAPVFTDSILPVVHAGLARFYDGPHVVDEHVTLEPAPGHSPGSSVVRLRSGSGSAVIAGDVLHTPMEVLHPDEGACFDEDPELAERSRLRFLAQAADRHDAVIAGHFPVDRAAVIGRRGDGYVIEGWMPYQ
ncbi:MBL fold metallo-hydrolase [Streptomyces sp. NPDC088847]|uniref:MBL fold metallo-hydrolase n=1 Tax=Streptomyces sp. NPDC088847 TaxID=3365909 RepID=UPI0037FA4014